MPSRKPHAGPPEHDRLVTCLHTLGVARAQLRAQRGTGRGLDKQALREDLLLALEQYASAIADLNAPVPRRLKAEILLYRRLKDRP